MVRVINLTPTEARKSLEILINNENNINSCNSVGSCGQLCSECILNNSNNTENTTKLSTFMLEYAYGNPTIENDN